MPAAKWTLFNTEVLKYTFKFNIIARLFRKRYVTYSLPVGRVKVLVCLFCLLDVLVASGHVVNRLKCVFLRCLIRVIQYVCLSRRLTDSEADGHEIYTTKDPFNIQSLNVFDTKKLDCLYNFVCSPRQNSLQYLSPFTDFAINKVILIYTQRLCQIMSAPALIISCDLLLSFVA